MANHAIGPRRGGVLPGPGKLQGEQYLYYPAPAPDVSGREHSQVLEYLQIIRRHIFSILLLAALGAGAGAAITYFAKPLYRSRVTLDIQQFDSNILNMKSGADPSANTVNPAEGYIQTEIKVLQSDVMVLRVIKAMKEAPKTEAPAAKQSDLAAWSKSFSSATPAKPLNMDAELAAIGRSLKVRTLGVTRIVEVLCDSQDPALAAQFCNTTAAEYIKANSEKREETLAQTASWLKKQLEETKLRLETSEEKLQSFAKDSSVLGAANENLAQTKLQQLQGALSVAEEELARKQAAYEQAKANEPEPGALPSFVDGPGVQYQLKAQDLKRQMAELTTNMTMENPAVIAVDRQLREMESAMTAESKASVKRYWSEFQAAQRRQALLKDNYSALTADLSSQAPKAVQYGMLKSEVESNQQLYEAMLRRAQELSIASAMRANTINVVDRAAPAPEPYSPNMKSNCIAGIAAGMFLGIGLAFVRSRSDRSLQDPGDAPGLLNVRELGVIPSATVRRSRSLLRRRSQVRLSAGGNAYREMIDLPDNSLELATLHQKNSPLAESFSAAMNSILFANENGINAKVIVVTSPEAGDGKTTIASNLAIALAQIDRKVLLIDGDLRRTRLSTLFRSDTEPGLIELLRSREPILDIPVTSVGEGWQLPNLYFLGAGDHALFEPRLLHSARMAEFICRVREEFDIVLIDSTPMVHIADARVLGRLADGVLLVFRAGKTSIDLATAAQRCFQDDGTHVLGTILNGWHATASSRYRSYGRYSKASA